LQAVNAIEAFSFWLNFPLRKLSDDERLNRPSVRVVRVG